MKAIKALKILLVLTFVLRSYGCQTLRRPSTTLTTVAGMESLRVDGTSRDLLIHDIRAQRLRHGLDDSGARMLTYHTKIQCHLDGALEACFVRSELPASPFYSPGTSISEQLAKEFISYATRSRYDLRDERVISADLVCNIVTAAAPPYTDQSAQCQIMNPRRPNEGYLNDIAAADAIKFIKAKSVEIAKSAAQLTTNVSCHYAGPDSAPECFWLESGDEAKERSPIASSQVIGRSLIQTHRYHQSVLEPEPRQAISDPSVISASVICQESTVQLTSPVHVRGSCRLLL